MNPRKEQLTNDGEKGLLGLIRVSDDAQAAPDRAGIPAQKASIERIARQNHLQIKWWIQIEGVNGAQVAKTPQMAELLRIAEGENCCGVAMMGASRLMRPDNYVDMAVLQQLKDHSVSLYFTDTVIDMTNPMGNFMGMLHVGMAALERDQIRARMVGGRYAKRERGEWICGANAVPFGLKLVKVNKRNLVAVDETRIGRVKRLFDLFLSGVTSFTDLSRETGIRYQSIRKILTNPIYTGWHEPKEKSDPKRNVYGANGKLRYSPKKPIPVEERQRFLLLEDAPISLETFQMTQRLLETRGEQRGSRHPDQEDPFTYRGVLKCAECGLKLIPRMWKGTAESNKREQYICRGIEGNTQWSEAEKKMLFTLPSGSCKTRRIRRDVLDAVCDGIIKKHLATPDFLERIMESYLPGNQVNDFQLETARLREEIAQAEASLRRNHDAYVRGRVPLELYEATANSLDVELRASRKALSKARPDVSKIDPEIWTPIARQFQMWGLLPAHQRRRLLRSTSPMFEVSVHAGKKKGHQRLFVKGVDLSVLTGIEFYFPIGKTIDVLEVHKLPESPISDDFTIYKLKASPQVADSALVAM